MSTAQVETMQPLPSQQDTSAEASSSTTNTADMTLAEILERTSGRPALPNDNVTVGDSHIHGRGLFAARALKKEERIIQFVGVPVAKDVVQRMPLEAYRYTYYVEDDLFLDGSVEWNLARFINSSCQPNCYSMISYWNDKPSQIWIVADRDIAQGEELTYNYNYTISDAGVCVCNCGAKHCVGVTVGEDYWGDEEALTDCRKRAKLREKRLADEQRRRAAAGGASSGVSSSEAGSSSSGAPGESNAALEESNGKGQRSKHKKRGSRSNIFRSVKKSGGSSIKEEKRKGGKREDEKKAKGGSSSRKNSTSASVEERKLDSKKKKKLSLRNLLGGSSNASRS
ncbi:Histone-lysine N-methyltransferase SUVR5 [Balamuthia mandrillaris]